MPAKSLNCNKSAVSIRAEAELRNEARCSPAYDTLTMIENAANTSSAWGTPLKAGAKRFLPLGSGELGREVALEAMRLGIKVIAVDSYAHAPAMQVAHRAHVPSMLNGEQLRDVILKEKPDLIVPEVEAIATQTLVELESEGWRVIPTACATQLTMNCEGIRRLVAEELRLPRVLAALSALSPNPGPV